MIDKQPQSLFLGNKRAFLTLLITTFMFLVMVQVLFAQSDMESFASPAEPIAQQGDDIPTFLETSNLSTIDISRTTAVSVSGVITHYTYLPVVYKPLPTPTLVSVGVPASNDNYVTYSMLVTWDDLGIAGGSYELQESQSADFENPTVYTINSGNTHTVNHTASFDSRFYYRVRFLKDTLASNWSNVIAQTGIYWDEFDDPASGWRMVRQDTDDVKNSLAYVDGNFKMKIGGRWDSMIASPLVPVGENWGGYRVRTHVLLGEGIDNLHSYGIVVGGDWNGVSACPGNYANCFNQYYRLNVVWSGHNNLKAHLKRVDGHNTVENTDSGQTLMEFRFVEITNANGWNSWTIDVLNNGDIKLYAGGRHVYTVNDDRYVGGGRYFGTFASADEYLGTAAFFAWYQVRPLP